MCTALKCGSRGDAGRGAEDEGPPRGHKRATLCVSSEVGCQMGCTFCATGTMGLQGDLTAGEIVEQLVHARRAAPIRNVVFMVRA
jgi:adenine C2-methylase RlmN of 23S rRNA A2503 and tRNA A37